MTIPSRTRVFLGLGAVLAISSSILRVASADLNFSMSAHGYVVSQYVQVRAAGRGKPWINLSDGEELPSSYSGQPQLDSALTGDSARSLSLASGDFDEDGVPDLVSGYGGSSGGIITLHRGNVDALFPNSQQSEQHKKDGTFTELPFLTPASAFELPLQPELLGTGDFDADGHMDVVATTIGARSLSLLPGDGHGELRPARTIQLPGRVTAMTVGEINREDGLADVVVAVVSESGPRVLVFEGPEGALNSRPEELVLPAARSIS